MKTIYFITFLLISFCAKTQTAYVIEFPLTTENQYQENCCITQGITYYSSTDKPKVFYTIHNFPIQKLDSLDQLGFNYLKSLKLRYEKTLPEKTKTKPKDLVYYISSNGRVFFHYHLPTQL